MTLQELEVYKATITNLCELNDKLRTALDCSMTTTQALKEENERLKLELTKALEKINPVFERKCNCAAPVPFNLNGEEKCANCSRYVN